MSGSGLGRASAHQTMDGTAPGLNRLDRLVWVTIKIDAQHIVCLCELRGGRIARPRHLQLGVYEAPSRTPHEVERGSQLLEFGLNDLRHHYRLGISNLLLRKPPPVPCPDTSFRTL